MGNTDFFIHIINNYYLNHAKTIDIEFVEDPSYGFNGTNGLNYIIMKLTFTFTIGDKEDKKQAHVPFDDFNKINFSSSQVKNIIDKYENYIQIMLKPVYERKQILKNHPKYTATAILEAIEEARNDK